MVKSGVTASSIGVITPYEGQRAYVTAHLSQSGTLRANQLSELEIASVDSFQGREKDYIVVSCVRSNDHSGIGFLSDPRRLNVALTRARYGCIIIGNPRVLAKQPLWHLLLTHFKGYGCLVEGALAALKVSHMHLPAPGRAFVARALALPGGGVPGGSDGAAAIGTDAAAPDLGAAYAGLGLGALAQHWPMLTIAAAAKGDTAATAAAPAVPSPTKRTGGGAGGAPGALLPAGTTRRSTTTRVRGGAASGSRDALTEFTSIQYTTRGTATSAAVKAGAGGVAAGGVGSETSATTTTATSSAGEGDGAAVPIVVTAT